MFNTAPFGKMGIGGPAFSPSAFEIYVTRHEQFRERSANLPALRLKDLSSHLENVSALANGLLSFIIEVLSKQA
jgi:hypothetical protein